MPAENTGEHFEANKNEDNRETFLQVMKTMQYVFQQKKERPQAQDGENIGSEHNKKILGDCKYRRNGIHRKNDVGRLYHQNHHKQRGKKELAVLAQKKFAAMMIGGERQKFVCELDDFAFTEINMLFFFLRQ